MDIDNDLADLEFFNNMAFDIELNQHWAFSDNGYNNYKGGVNK